MFVIFGTKKFGVKKVGYGKDYCNACEQEAVVDKWRWFTWFHIFWIPLIPLGFHHNWICTLCSRDANGRYTTGVFLKIVFSLILLALVILMFQPDVTDSLEYEWLLKIISIAMFLTSVAWIKRHKKLPSKKTFRENITPMLASTCLYCDGPLTSNPLLSCESCKLRVYEKIN